MKHYEIKHAFSPFGGPVLVERIKDWSGQKIAILGAARQGLALARYLLQHGATVVLNDQRTAEQMENTLSVMQDLTEEQTKRLSWIWGGHSFSVLDNIDLLCISGGVPLTLPIVIEAIARGIPLANDSQLFLEVTPAKVIGITGSAGKTTTTTLVGRMAQSAVESLKISSSTPTGRATRPPEVWVGGNIGQPLIAKVDEMQPQDLVIMELSSFQLEIMTSSPQAAAVLNITPNHLDRHGKMEAYTAAKARILEFQKSVDVAILGCDDPGAWSLAKMVQGRLLSFGLSELPDGFDGTFYRRSSRNGSAEQGMICLRDGDSETELIPRTEILLRGDHNILNVLAACAISAAVGLPNEAMVAGISGFTGVAHRLEFVRRWRGADWYNDSIATAPERSMAAIRSFDEPLVLLAGGRDKDLPWEEFAELVCQRVDQLILFGEAAEKILKAIQSASSENTHTEGVRAPEIIRCKNLRGAVQAAAEVVQPGDVVLLSPGGTSFDEFNDFEERGLCFAQWVRELN